MTEADDDDDNGFLGWGGEESVEMSIPQKGVLRLKEKKSL